MEQKQKYENVKKEYCRIEEEEASKIKKLSIQMNTHKKLKENKIKKFKIFITYLLEIQSFIFEFKD